MGRKTWKGAPERPSFERQNIGYGNGKIGTGEEEDDPTNQKEKAGIHSIPFIIHSFIHSFILSFILSFISVRTSV